MSNEIKLGKIVGHKDVYDGKEALKITGIREHTVELEGDYSGGTHKVIQSEWLSIDGIVFPEKKICPNKVNGSCPLHNLFCQYPECEE